MPILVFLAFVSLGLPDGVVGLAWPSLRAEYGLAQADLGILLVGAGPGYFVSGLVAGRVMIRFGLAATLVASALCLTVGLALFAAALPWPLPILALGIGGLGAGTIDSGMNVYAAARFSTRQVNWLHACYSAGAATGPAIMTAALSSGAGWRVGYAVLAALQGGMTVVFAVTGSSWQLETSATDTPAEPNGREDLWQALTHPLVPIQTALFFTYTGVEAALGTWSYTVLTEGRGFPAYLAGIATSAYFAAILAGRVVLGAGVERIGADRLVRLGTFGALGGAMLFAAGPAWLACVGLILAGLSLAPIFPTLIARSSTRLSPEVAIHAVGLKVSAAMLGSAGMPIAAGLAAQWLGLWSVGVLCVAVSVAVVLLHEGLLRRDRLQLAPA